MKSETLIATRHGFMRYRVTVELTGVESILLCNFIACVDSAIVDEDGRVSYRIKARSCDVGLEDREIEVEMPEHWLNSKKAFWRALLQVGGIGFCIQVGAGAATIRATLQTTTAEYAGVGRELDIRRAKRECRTLAK
jgi:hypothetical protein